MKIWLDDHRRPPDTNWVWVDNSKAVIDMLSRFQVSEISLDHDLGDENLYGNGYQVLLWIEEKVFTDTNYVPPIIQIHTANPVARQKMLAARNSIDRELLK